MSTLITVFTSELPERAHVAKSILESESIPVFLQDEFTVQNYNFASNAIGGVKVQVREEDYDRARAIMLEGGFIENEQATELLGIWSYLDKVTQKTFIKNLPLEIRIVILVLFFILLLLLPLIIIQGRPI